MIAGSRTRRRSHAVPSEPVFEAFAVELERADDTRAVKDVMSTLPDGPWDLRRFGPRRAGLDLTSDLPIPPDEAWSIARRLQSISGVAWAEPLFEVPVADPEAAATAAAAQQPGREAGTKRFCRPEDAPPESTDPEWSIGVARVREAWALFEGTGRRPGEGIVVAHPDTGYRPHFEIRDRLKLDVAWDFIHDDPDALDEFEHPLLDPVVNPGHGTATASVIVSPLGAQGGSSPVHGVAPHARLVPLRTTHAVFLRSTRRLSRALEHAASARDADGLGMHVASMSLGALEGSRRLDRAVATAVEAGVVPCAAAGNIVLGDIHFVTWPAAHPDVTAVGGCTAMATPWEGSCWGPEVDVSGPAAYVWRARVVVKHGHEVRHDVAPGCGTSYAVAGVAGVAALWLSYHGREALLQRYPGALLARAFATLVRRTATVPASWRPGFGSGIISADALLRAPLPDVPDVRDVRAALPLDPVAARFRVLFPDAAPADRATRDAGGVATIVARVMDWPEEDAAMLLAEHGEEIAFLAATNPLVHRALRRALDTAAGDRSATVRAESRDAIDLAREELLGRSRVSRDLWRSTRR